MLSFLAKYSQLFDRLVSPKHVRMVELLILRFALMAFVLHLGFIFLANNVLYFKDFQHSYLKAIYTPFSFILFYEVLLLVIIIPKSISEFIGKQFEVITLITLRSFFHDIADIDFTDIATINNPNFINILYDLGASIIMLFSTLVYNKMYKKHGVSDAHVDLEQFIKIKKVLSVIMCGVLIGLSFISLFSWLTDVRLAFQNKTSFPNPNTVFYTDFFTIMIFVDVLLLIISFIYQFSFNLIFRNASFIITTILIRMSLSMTKPMNYLIIIIGLAFSIVTYFIYSKMTVQKIKD